MKRKYLKIAVTPEFYATLARTADERGVTLAALIRAQLEQPQPSPASSAIEAALARIEAQLAQGATKPAGNEHEQLLTEIVLLVRELAAERNAQVLARVRQQLNAQFNGGRARV